MGMLKYLIFLFIIILFNLTGCGTSNHYVSIKYNAETSLNPDINARPSPLVVVVYQLHSVKSFNEADFFSLYEQPKLTLGNDLINQIEEEIKPGQNLETKQLLSPNTQYLGIIAAYRDIDNAQWRKVIQLNKNKSLKLTIQLNKKGMEANVKT